MVKSYSDLAVRAGRDVVGRRCINCGEYVDGLVLLNRRMQQGIARLPLQLGRGRSVPRPLITAYDPPTTSRSMTNRDEWISPGLTTGLAQCPADFGAIATHSVAIRRAEPVS